MSQHEVVAAPRSRGSGSSGKKKRRRDASSSSGQGGPPVGLVDASGDEASESEDRASLPAVPGSDVDDQGGPALPPVVPADPADGDGDDQGLGQAFTLLEVAERLIDDLESHERGFLIDLKPKRLLSQISELDKQMAKLERRARVLRPRIDLADEQADLLELYEQIIDSYDAMKSWSKRKGTPAGGLRDQKHRIEQRFGVKGRKKVRLKAAELASQEDQLREELDRIERAVLRLDRIKLEVSDRAIAFGVQLEEHAISHDPTALFPFGADVRGQLAYIEHWSARFPDVQQASRAHLEEISGTLQVAKEIRSAERAYAFEALTHQQVVDDYEELRKPGTSKSQAVKVTFTVGTGLEGGAFVQVTGSVATGDDRKVRPSLAFKVGLVGQIDLGLWKASASIGVTYAMTEGYQSLEHFAAHYMRLLSLYNLSFKRYAELQAQLNHLPEDSEEYAAKRDQMIDEAAARGFVGEDDTVLVGDEDQRDLAALQALPPMQIRAVTGDVELGLEPGDEASGFAEYLGGFSFSASYTRKWFTRLVDYDRFVQANADGDATGELARLRKVRADYVELVARLDRVRKLISSAVVGGVPPDLRAEEAELAKLKNVYEEGHLTFFRRGRKAFLAEVDERIQALSTAPDEGRSTQTDEGVAVEDVRMVNDRAKKELTKTGSVVEVAVSGSFKAGGLGLTLAGKFTHITNDANPDNDGTYFNYSLELGTSAEGEVLDPDSDAGQDALEAIAESGEFEMQTVEPTASVVTGTVVTNLAQGVESFGAALSGGLKAESNLVLKNGGFRCQYVRLTRSRKISSAVKARTPYGMNVGVSYEGGKTDHIAEWLGSTTLTYLQTIYDGLQGHPDPDAEWQAYLAAHRKQVWALLLAAMTHGTNTREELLKDLGGQRLFDRYFPEVASYRHQVEYGVGDLEASDGPPPIHDGLFDGILGGLVTLFDDEFERRGSLEVTDLAAAGWQSAEGAVHSEVTQHLGADLKPWSKPMVASTNKLTRGAKGSFEARGLAQYGTFGRLMDAGAKVHLVLEAKGRSPLKLTFDPAKDPAKVIGKAAAKLEAWVPEGERDLYLQRLHARSFRQAVDELLQTRIPG